jgi:EpsG family
MNAGVPGLAVGVMATLRADPALLFVVSLAFVLQPALTLALAMLLAWLRPQAGPRGLGGVLVLGALYLALINVTKVPDNDLEGYLESFEAARNMDLISFLLIYTREPLYYVAQYGLANLSFVNGSFYVFLSTLVPYLLFGTGVLRLGIALQLERRALLSLLIFLLFLGPLFSLSAHLLRQFLASSLMMLFLAEQAITGRRRWGLGLLGFMVHYSSLPLLLLSLVRPFRRSSTQVSLLFNLLTLLLLYSSAVLVAPLLLDVPVLGMVFGRVVNGMGAELDPLPLSALGIAALLLAISLYSMAGSKRQVLAVQEWHLMLCMVTVCIIVIVSSVQPSLSEIAARYFAYLYFLIGLVLPFLMVRVPMSCWLIHGVALMSLPLFFFNLAYGVWSFAPVASLLFQPAWMLWGYLGNSGF